MRLSVPPEALEIVRPLFVAVEGDCEAWADDEIVQRLFIRGAMEYAKSAHRPFPEVTQVAGDLRKVLSVDQ